MYLHQVLKSRLIEQFNLISDSISPELLANICVVAKMKKVVTAHKCFTANSNNIFELEAGVKRYFRCLMYLGFMLSMQPIDFLKNIRPQLGSFPIVEVPRSNRWIFSFWQNP